jgi:protein O-GlcNAc transferase
MAKSILDTFPVILSMAHVAPYHEDVHAFYSSNHPLAHLMLSTFSLHDPQRFNIFVYATTGSDNSNYRQRIEQDAQIFRDVSTSPTQAVVEQITEDKIHVLVNLGGYTKAARNDIFATRPCPVQMSLMGYAATSGAG